MLDRSQYFSCFLLPPHSFFTVCFVTLRYDRANFHFRQPRVDNIYEIIHKINMIDKVFAKRRVY